MTRLLSSIVCVVIAGSLLACDTTQPDRRADAGAELDAFFGASSSGVNVRTSNPTPRANPGTPNPKPDATPAIPGANDPSLDWADPCVNNLDELNGALLLYYSAHRKLPPSLEQIPKLSPAGTPISLTCPAGGKPYVYHPDGLKPPVIVDDKGNFRTGTLLILYDAQPSHQITLHLTDGNDAYDVKKTVRYGIVMEPPRAVLNQSVQLFVVPIEQNLLDMYLRNSQTPGPVIRPVPSAPR